MASFVPPTRVRALASAVCCILMCAPAAALLFAAPAPVSAQGIKREVSPPGYSEAISDAVHELELGNFAEARDQFRRAHEINPNARTLRGLGLVEFELRNYGESAALLQQALDSVVKPLEGKLRSDAEKVLQRAKSYLGEVHVATVPEAATVTVDGTVMELGPSGTLVLEVGDHTFEFHAEGRLPTKQTVSVRGGGRESLKVVLRPAASAPSTSEVSSSDTTQPTRLKGKPAVSTRQYVAITVAAVGVASLATGIGFGVVARNKHEQSGCDEGKCRDEGARSLDGEAQTAGRVSTATFILGAAALGAGAALFFWPSAPNQRETATARIRVWPALSRDLVGAGGKVVW